MDVKKLALLVGALVVAVITAVMAKNMFAGAGAQQAAAQTVPVGPKVLVAKKALPVGTIIDADSFTFQPWPKELMQSAYYVEGQPDGDPRKLLGTVVRYQITAGQPVTRGSLVGPQDRGFLAAALGPGMRAITVPVNTSSSVAGFVFPGDHVDMVLTQTVSGGGEGPALKVSETIIRNLRVLATDQRITEKNDNGKTQVKTFSNVTLEVTPRIAEKISVAQSIGSLSLSLRSIADNTSDLERRLPLATSRFRPAPIRLTRSRCCSRWPTVRSTTTRPSRPAATCRASSAAPSPHQQNGGKQMAQARGRVSARRSVPRRCPLGAGRPGRSRQYSHRCSGGSSLT